MPSYTHRTSAARITTTLSGRVTTIDAQSFIDDGLALMPVPVWLFDAIACTSYAPEAIDVAAKGLLACKAKGLQRVVAIVPSAMLRMAASLVRMLTKMDLQTAATKAEAETLCRLPTAT